MKYDIIFPGIKRRYPLTAKLLITTEQGKLEKFIQHNI